MPVSVRVILAFPERAMHNRNSQNRRQHFAGQLDVIRVSWTGVRLSS
jgi:hypothetical protein